MALCLKLLLLTVYFLLLFLLGRLLELIAWYEGGLITYRFLDPMTLSVLKLKSVLENRGISYSSIVEKNELSSLVEVTGTVSDEEADVAILDDASAESVTNFTCGSHFYEQVEDTKDSVWLVQVLTESHAKNLLAEEEWKSIRKKLGKFGVRSGILDCSLDARLCDRKGWYTTRLILALPQSFQIKANVVLYTYTGATKVNSIYDWVKTKLESKVLKIQTFQKFNEEWGTNNAWKNERSELQAIYFSSLVSLPLFFSALTVKFPGRARFGSVNTKTKEGKRIMKSLNLTACPSYVIFTPENMYVYGSRPGELLTFSHAERFLKSLYPEVNDLFVISLTICNIISCFEFFLVQGSIFRRLPRLVWCTIKYNITLIIVWLPILAVFQLRFMEGVIEWGLSAIRYLSCSHIACLLRKDISIYSLHVSLLVSTFLTYSMVIGFIEYKRKEGQELEAETNWWNFTELRNMRYILTPVSNLRLPLGQGQDSFDFFHSQLAAPTLWLQPMMSLDYIKELPTWRHPIMPNVCDADDTPESGYNEYAQYLPSSRCACLRHHGETAASHAMTPEDIMDANYKCDCQMADVHPDAIDVAVESGRKIDQELTKSMPDEHGGISREDCGIPPGYGTCSQCVICLDGYQFGVMLCGLPCGHSFHEQCIMAWLMRDNHICPVCRWPSFQSKTCIVHLHSE